MLLMNISHLRITDARSLIPLYTSNCGNLMAESGSRINISTILQYVIEQNLDWNVFNCFRGCDEQTHLLARY